MTTLSPGEVVTCVREVLTEDVPLHEEARLLEVPGFSSLVLAALVESLERRLGREIPPERIVPETFESPRSIALTLGWAPPAVVSGVGSNGAAEPNGSTPGSAPSATAVTTGAPVEAPAAIRLLHDLVDAAAAAAPSAAAVVSREERLTYAELRRESLAVAASLRALGVRRGDRVVLRLGNDLGTLVALMGCSRVGATFVPVSPAMPARRFDELVADCRPALVVTLDPATEERRAQARVVDWAMLRRGGEGAAAALAADPTSISMDPACLIYTSGSSGRPKAVVCPHRNMLFALDAIDSVLPIASDDVIGCVLPLSFDYGLYQAFLAFRNHATLALGTDQDTGPGLLRFMTAFGVTGLPLVPSLAAALFKLASRMSDRTAGRVRWITNTGAYLAPPVADRLLACFPEVRLYPMFGLTECKRVSILRHEERAARPESVGRPLPDTECIVVDPVTREALPPDRVGELVVRGPHVMAGYWGEQETTGTHFARWGAAMETALFTGDSCHIDAEGYLYFHGRLDETFKHRGFRVTAGEVERAAHEIDGVTHAAVLVPRDGEPLTLAVAGDGLAKKAIRTALADRLDDYMVPEHVVVLPSLPLSGTGKVDKTALRSLVEARP